MAFKIIYQFKDDQENFTCTVTHEQYRNFKNLPSISKCEIIKEDQENIEAYKDEMQNALNLAAANDTSHIRKLSECV